MSAIDSSRRCWSAAASSATIRSSSRCAAVWAETSVGLTPDPDRRPLQTDHAHRPSWSSHIPNLGAAAISTISDGTASTSQTPTRGQFHRKRDAKRTLSAQTWFSVRAEPGFTVAGDEGAATAGHGLPQSQRHLDCGVTGWWSAGAVAWVMGAISAMRSASMVRRRRRVAPRARRPSSLKAS
jgi:hypothetical protein